MDDLDHYLSVCEVARLLRVSPAAVRRWISRGRLAAVRDRASRRYLVPRAAALARLEAVRPEPPVAVALMPMSPQTRATLKRHGLLQ